MAVIARDFRWRFLYPDPRLVGAIQFEYSRGLPATSLRAYSKVVVFPVQ
jgi:hypothetical protein